MALTREQIADEIEFFEQNGTPGFVLARETRGSVDRLMYCEPNEKPWLTSSRWDPYFEKLSSGTLCPFGHMCEYETDGHFDKQAYLSVE